MSVQSRTNHDNVPFIRGGNAYDRDDLTIAQDETRTTDLLFGTVMATVAATQQWVPFTDETATDGSAIPQGVYCGETIAAADIAAGDVEGAKIIVGGRCVLDVDQIVVENDKTLATVITVGTTDLRTVRDHLEDVGIFLPCDIVDIDEYENT
jgi:hypothetical protein